MYVRSTRGTTTGLVCVRTRMHARCRMHTGVPVMCRPRVGWASNSLNVNACAMESESESECVRASVFPRVLWMRHPPIACLRWKKPRGKRQYSMYTPRSRRSWVVRRRCGVLYCTVLHMYCTRAPVRPCRHHLRSVSAFRRERGPGLELPGSWKLALAVGPDRQLAPRASPPTLRAGAAATCARVPSRAALVLTDLSSFTWRPMRRARGRAVDRS
ncbi:hypothetical protein PYCCODRAFT_1205993 [Trametes coccinea BRFM310]|uniref:Uncharacterized protein n=1 Tax=Trametes coccinea (strain BRFM310) TaxID=1353009 RepID=A0A1Y2I762_TRAC3|nr:hypothetical protein PYCCODRAFT_1205993 [Trametes coccinea BRFM310]